MSGKRGRPFTEAGARTERVYLTLWPEEKDELTRRASSAGESVAAYLRRRGLEQPTRPAPNSKE